MKNRALNRYVKTFLIISGSLLIVSGAFIAVFAHAADGGFSPSRVAVAEGVIIAFMLLDVALLMHILKWVERVDFRDGYFLVDTGMTRKGHSYYLNYDEVFEIESRRGLFGNRPELIIIRAELNGKKKTFRYCSPIRRGEDELTFDQCKKHFTHAVVRE